MVNGSFVRAIAIVCLIAMSACSSGANNPLVPTAPGNGAATGTGATADASAPAMDSAGRPITTMRSCGIAVAPGHVRCYAILRTDLPSMTADDARNATPEGYGPAQLQNAYRLPSSSHGKGQTVAIVDAYDDPTAEADLGVYRAQFGLPLCTTANGCFKKVGELSSLPPRNPSWAQEESLDMDMVSAACPNCKIILVEANSTQFNDLGAGVNKAISMGADVVSNSYGGTEFAATSSQFSHPGHIIVASAGDDGTGAAQPCSFSSVVCAGGTSLFQSGSARGWTESAWSGTGSGCSSFVAKPAWQHDKGCKRRTEVDASSDADPQTGVAVYDSTKYQGYVGWLVFGGTSASSPFLSGVFALAGNAKSTNAASGIWARGSSAADFNDVTKGSNGNCSQHYICHAGKGYDGPTGWGTPNGIGGF